MTARGLIIAAPHSGAGKTTVTLALIAALKRRNIAVRQPKPGLTISTRLSMRQ